MQSLRYRDKERVRPTTPSAAAAVAAPATTATVRSTTPSEKKPTINLTVNPKTIANPAASGKSVGLAKVTKKIDMGAATNYGARSDLGINSPTHRSTHAEGDLFSAEDSPSVTVSNQPDLLDDIFKTCAPSGTITPPTNQNRIDDDFNPRADDAQEFGDFASAFGNGSVPPTPTAVSKPASVGDEFADFSSAFVPAAPGPATIDAVNTNDFLFGSPNITQPLFSQSEPTSLISNKAPVADLLSDLDGLSLGAPVPIGKFPRNLLSLKLKCRATGF